MAIKFYSSIDLRNNELQHAKLHVLGSAPTSPSPQEGQIYYNSGDDTVYTYDGSSWNGLASSGAMTAWILEDDDGTEVSISNAEEIKFIGSGITTNWTDVSTGSDGDPFDLTFTVDAAQTGITSIYATDLIMGEDAQTAIDFATPNEIDFKADNASRLTLTASVLKPKTNNQIDLGTSSLEFKDAFFDGTVTSDAFAGPLTGNVTGDVSGSAATVTTAAQSAITSLGTLTTLTVDNVIINGTNIGHTSDTDSMAIASDGVVTFSQVPVLPANTIDSAHYVDGSIDNAHIADDAIDSEHYAATSIDTAHLSADCITGAKIADDAIDSEHYTDGSIDTAHIADDQVTLAKMAGLASTKFILGNGSGNPAAVTMSGDATMSNTGAVTITQSAGDFTVTGDLTVSGDTTTVNTATLAVEDPLIKLATGNTSGDAIDIGFYGLYDNTGSQDVYTGLTRDASDDKWHLWKLNQAEPTTTVNHSGTGFAVDTLVANLQGNVTGDVTGDLTGQADTVATIAGLAPNTATTQATQGAITSAANLATVGTIGTGVWQGTAVASAYLDADTAHLSGTQTFTGTKTLNSFKGTAGATVTNILDEDAMGSDSATALATQQSIKAYADTKSVIAGSSSIVTTGALNSGSITSGFGTIDTGSSAITTTGLISGGSLDIDDVLINAASIGHSDDTDLITLSDGVVTIAGEVDATSLDISGNADIDGTLETDALTINGTAIVAQSTASAVGGVELATAAEVITGTDTARVVTADTLSAKSVVATIDQSSLTDSLIVTITHNLGTADVIVQLYDISTEETVFADVYRTTDDLSTASTSVISIDFGTAPPSSSNDIRCLITSLAGATASPTIAYT